MQTYTIGRLAAAANVHVETVRYYQRRGLLAEPARPPRGVRCYSRSDTDRLRFIKRAQAMGFTLSEIKELIDTWRHRSCRATKKLLADKLQKIETRMSELRRLRKELKQWVANCEGNIEDQPCPALVTLADTGSQQKKLTLTRNQVMP